MTKICVKCGEPKLETKEFFRPNPINGLRNDCRECEKKAQKARYDKDPEKVCAASRKWCRDNPEKHAATKRNWSRRNPDKVAAQQRKKNYGISEIEFHKLFTDQNGKCAICGFQFPGMFTGDRTQSPHLDHCHISGKIRGLLCSACNTVLGRSKDSVDILLNAVQYLLKNS